MPEMLVQQVVCPLCSADNPPEAVRCGVCGAPLSGELGTETVYALPTGTALRGGAYTIERPLGQGGFGITYRGLQADGAVVAIKELFPEGSSRQGPAVVPPPGLGRVAFEDARARFLYEAAALRALDHPSIVKLRDVFEDHATAYLVQDFVDGETLAARIARRKTLPLVEVAVLVTWLADALEALHERGLLHRDVSPDNVILPESGRPVLIDFGAAREFRAGTTLRHSRIIKLGYAPPEQYAISARRGPATDTYALAATIYHALTGQPPAPAADRFQADTLARPRDLNPFIPPPAERALLRALEMRIDRRTEHPVEFSRELQGHGPSRVSQLLGRMDELLGGKADAAAAATQQAPAPILADPAIPLAGVLTVAPAAPAHGSRVTLHVAARRGWQPARDVAVALVLRASGGERPLPPLITDAFGTARQEIVLDLPGRPAEVGVEATLRHAGQVVSLRETLRLAASLSTPGPRSLPALADGSLGLSPPEAPAGSHVMLHLLARRERTPLRGATVEVRVEYPEGGLALAGATDDEGAYVASVEVRPTAASEPIPVLARIRDGEETFELRAALRSLPAREARTRTPSAPPAPAPAPVSQPAPPLPPPAEPQARGEAAPVPQPALEAEAALAAIAPPVPAGEDAPTWPSPVSVPAGTVADAATEPTSTSPDAPAAPAVAATPAGPSVVPVVEEARQAPVAAVSTARLADQDLAVAAAIPAAAAAAEQPAPPERPAEVPVPEPAPTATGIPAATARQASSPPTAAIRRKASAPSVEPTRQAAAPAAEALPGEGNLAILPERPTAGSPVTVQVRARRGLAPVRHARVELTVEYPGQPPLKLPLLTSDALGQASSTFTPRRGLAFQTIPVEARIEDARGSFALRASFVLFPAPSQPRLPAQRPPK